MALENTNFLEMLIGAGNDAFKNLYYASFTGGAFGTEASPLYTVRLKGFDVPEVSQESYPVKFLNEKIDLPVAKVNVKRSVSLTFRVDSGYNIYKNLLSQMNKNFAISKHRTYVNINDLKDSLFKINVYAGMSENSENIFNTDASFSFESCWVSSLDVSEYSSDGSTPLEVTANINFLRMNDFAEDLSVKNTNETEKVVETN